MDAEKKPVGAPMTPLNEVHKNINDKISETNYFFTMMKKNESDLPTFRYNLAAFLCSGHAVRDIIKDYCKGCNSKWINEQPIESNEIGLFFWKLRTISVHKQSANPPRTTVLSLLMSFCIKGQPEVVAPSDLPKTEVKGYFFEPMDNDLRNKIKEELKNKGKNPDSTLNHIDEILRRKDVFTLCDEYLQMLLKLAEDFKKESQTMQTDK